MTPPDLADLDAFVAVAQSRSFRGAAALRNVSASSLSETIRRLEGRLGVRLLNRTTRSVTPTEAGLRLLERLQPVERAVFLLHEVFGCECVDIARMLSLSDTYLRGHLEKHAANLH